MVLRTPWRRINSYIRSIRRLIRVLGYQGVIVGTMRQMLFAWMFPLGLYQVAGWRLRNWLDVPANRELNDRMVEFARLNKGLIAMCLDGTQHHRPQRGALHLHSLGCGQMVQPWQGEGVLRDNGHGKLVPYALTASRRDRLTTEVVDGLSLVPMEGFDRIEFCRESHHAVPGCRCRPSL